MQNKPATTTTTQSRTPWSGVSSQMSDLSGRIGSLGQDTSLFAPSVSDTTYKGIEQVKALGNKAEGYDLLKSVLPGSSEGFATGLGQLQRVASGEYINPNQYLRAALEPAAQDVINRVNGQFTAAGRYGSGAHTGALTRELGNLESQAYLNNYNTERGRQDAAAGTLNAGGYTGAGFAGALDQTAMTPAMRTLQAGQMLDRIDSEQKQAPLRAAEWQQQQIMPMATAFGSSTGTQQTVQPVNKLTQGLGLGMMGLVGLGMLGIGGDRQGQGRRGHPESQDRSRAAGGRERSAPRGECAGSGKSRERQGRI